MKLQLINLDPEDDHHSARDKLSAAKADRVVLVWPRRGRVLARRLDLVLLQRHALRQGAQLGLVCHDPAVRAFARALGIPTFDSPDRLPEPAWQAVSPAAPPARPGRRPIDELHRLAAGLPDPTPTLTELPPAAGRALAGLAVACALAVAVSMFPRAEIAVSPRRQTQILPIQFVLDPELEVPWSSRRIRSETALLSLEGEQRGPASGRTRVPSAAAGGTVVLTNLTDEPTTVPAGTGLRASDSGVRFLTLEALELEGEVGAEAEVPVQAAQPGPGGNLPAGAIDAVEGSIGFVLSVTNPEPTTGGAQADSPAVSASDRARLRQELTAALRDQADRAMDESLALGQLLVPGSVEISQVLEERFDREIGQPTATLGLYLRIEFVGLAVETEALEQAAAQQLAADLPEGTLVIPDSLRLRRDPANDGQLPSGELLLGYTAEQHIADQIDFDQVRQVAAGRWAAAVPSVLAERFELGRPPLVRNSPAWFPWMPWLDIRLDVHWVWDST